MACNDATSGFVNNGVAVTGSQKACAVKTPTVQASAVCAGATCQTTDAATCCGVQACCAVYDRPEGIRERANISELSYICRCSSKESVNIVYKIGVCTND